MVNPGLSRFKQPWAVPFVVAVLLSLFPVDSIADSIELDGTQFQDVYIRESATLYYICLPDDGRILNIRKTDVEPESVKITEDFEARRAIFARWKAHHAKFAKIPEERIDLVTDSSGDEAGRSGPSESLVAGTPVPILRGKGVRRYNPELAARIQANLARMRGGSAPTGSIGSGSGTMSGGSGGSGGSGSGSGGGGGGATFSNISDLFGTIDDSEVGELPNPFSKR